MWAPDRMRGGRNRRNPSEHLVAPQGMRATRNQVPEAARTATVLSENEGPAAARTSRRPPTPTTESKGTGGRPVKGVHEEPSSRPVEQVACRRTWSRDGAGAPPRPADGTSLARLLDRRMGRRRRSSHIDHRKACGRTERPTARGLPAFTWCVRLALVGRAVDHDGCVDVRRGVPLRARLRRDDADHRDGGHRSADDHRRDGAKNASHFSTLPQR